MSTPQTRLPLLTAGSAGQQLSVTVGFCLVAAIAYLSRNCLGVFAADPAFRTELGASQDELGYAMSSFLLSYALFQIPAGWLGQRVGSRIVLTLYAAVWSGATALLAFCHSVTDLMIVMALVGAAQAGVFPNSARSISDWLPTHRRAIACGFMAAFMSIGGAIAVALTGYLVGDRVGFRWQAVVVMFAIPGIVWSVAFGILFRDRPMRSSNACAGPDSTESGAGGFGAGESGVGESGIGDSTTRCDSEPDAAELSSRAAINWFVILSSPALWLVNGQQFFRAAGYIFFATWFPTYLREVHKVSLESAGWLASLPLMAVVAGASLGGILTDVLLKATGSRTIGRKLVAITCLTACGGLTVSAMWAQSTTAAMTLITSGSFLAAIAGPCAYAQTIDLAGRNVPVVFGLMNMIGNLGAALCPLAVTFLKNRLDSWEPVLGLFCAIYLAAAVCWGLLNAEATLDS